MCLCAFSWAYLCKKDEDNNNNKAQTKRENKSTIQQNEKNNNNPKDSERATERVYVCSQYIIVFYYDWGFLTYKYRYALSLSYSHRLRLHLREFAWYLIQQKEIRTVVSCCVAFVFFFF